MNNAEWTGIKAMQDELNKLRTAAYEMEKALEPFSRYSEVIGDNPPPGNSDVIHAYHCVARAC